MENHFLKIAAELGTTARQVAATVTLLDQGATVPFISRYRKEVTGLLDEVAVATIRDRIAQLRELDKRREAILKSLEELGKLTPELTASLNAAETMAQLEDIYLPYKPKRRTKATIAREKGLEPLAEELLAQELAAIEQLAATFLNEEKGVNSIEEALAGARDIIAEKVSENAEVRALMRTYYEQKGRFKARVIPGKEEEGIKYKDYFEWEEDIATAPSHRVLALRRAEKEMIISLEAMPSEEEAVFQIEQQLLKGYGPASEQVRLAIKDSYKRLLGPSMETEIRMLSKKRADEEAIKVFADNLRQLLLAAPLGQKNVLAIDPGFRTGCKIVCLNSQGKLMHNDTIYPNEPQRKVAESGIKIRQMCEQFQIEAIAIGNGTASRETEQFVKDIHLPKHIQIVMVNESGASIYSASEVARNEFPDHDLTVRGAVSIGRRLMDPLAELVKIDPKSIGVGQYQHDVDQLALRQSLDDVVISCVNAVGVEVNTASKELLTYVSGLGPALAQNIIEFRNQNGPFKSRSELKKVPRLGDKAFEQAAGFLRIHNGSNPLDSSAVHPESYNIVERMAKDMNCTVKDLMDDSELRRKIELKNYVSDTVGMPTLHDIMQELAKPGRDPREQFEAFSFADSVEKIEDVKPGMKLPGIVTNITNFGAFVDIGVHQDGLVHLSQIADRYIEHPSEVLKVHQRVEVTVLEVDMARKRISLTIKGNQLAPAPRKNQDKKTKPEAEPANDMQAKLAQLKSRFR